MDTPARPASTRAASARTSRADGPGDAELVPVGLRAAAAWTWRILVVAFGVYGLLRLLSIFEVLVVPVLVALLVVAFLRPLVDLVAAGPDRAGLPRGAASLLAIVLTLLVVAGMVTLIGQQVATGFGDLKTDTVEGWQELQRQLARGPLHVTSDQLSSYVDQATASVKGNSGKLVNGALQVGTTAADIGTGFFVVLFSTFFFLSSGDRIWAWLVHLFPVTARRRVDGAGVRAWSTLTSYVRATVVVAFVDGAGVGIVAAVLGVPLAFPLGVLVFLGAFVPVVGALVSGIVAVLVALVAKGPIVALIMLGGLIAVNQLEAHVMQPFLMGRAVRVHPLAVILSIGAGVLLAGIVGGLFAVPIAAVVNVVADYLASDRPAPESDDDPAGGALGEVGNRRGPDPRTDADDAARAAGPLADAPEDASARALEP